MSFKCKIGLHSWNGCKCSECEKTRDEQHDWSKDCEKCSKCGRIRENQHKSNGNKCYTCGQERVYSYDYVLNEVKKSMDVQDEIKSAEICVAIIKLEGNCLKCLLEIIQDKKLDMYTRRKALWIASGYNGEQLSEFIKVYCLAGKTKSGVYKAYVNVGNDENYVNLALFNTGEEILNTPDFFQLYMAK